MKKIIQINTRLIADRAITGIVVGATGGGKIGISLGGNSSSSNTNNKSQSPTNPNKKKVNLVINQSQIELKTTSSSGQGVFGINKIVIPNWVNFIITTTTAKLKRQQVDHDYSIDSISWSTEGGVATTTTVNIPSPISPTDTKYCVDSNYVIAHLNKRIEDPLIVKLVAISSYQFDKRQITFDYQFEAIKPYKISRDVDSFLSSTNEEEARILDFLNSKQSEMIPTTNLNELYILR